MIGHVFIAKMREPKKPLTMLTEIVKTQLAEPAEAIDAKRVALALIVKIAVNKMSKTAGEKTFEDYLDKRQTKYQFELLMPDKRRPPDYTIFHDRQYLLEVKDFNPTDVPEAGAYDGYARIRSKIDSASKKFQEYEGYPCGLVLYNNDARLVDVITPQFVLGAMYGNVGVVVPFTVETGEAIGEEYQAFLGGGKMIRPHWKNPENTRISALITLRYVNVGTARLNEYVAKIKSDEVDRIKRATDVLQQLQKARLEFDRDEKHLGVIVWENSFAAIPFPRDLFDGDYDEIYGVQDKKIQRVFAGKGVVEYERIKAEGQPRSLFDILKKN
jgi:hypothetical protein